ncbi:MAG: ABC transporter ATP-binding protein [Deltaproteobacteria bacterium]|nr:ABC transporter ATP-binding protein [Deltaproteobacteria bacterium]
MNPLEVVNLSKTFGGPQALSGISFSVLQGDILGIIGPNGAGKTTLFNCITRFLPFDSGSVILFGRNIEGRKPHQVVNLGLTRTWQLVKPFFGMRVMEAIMVPSFCSRARAKHHSKKARQENVVKILKDIGLYGKIWQEVDNLNQGELRVLDIARALVTFPKILLLDEPFSGLSHKEIEIISDVVRKLNIQGLTVVIIEHRLRELMKLVQKVVVINFGRKIAEGSPEVIVRDPNVIEAYLGQRRPKIALA